MNLQPLGDRLIVEALEDEETTASGIVLPDTAKEKPQRGRVLAIGPGVATTRASSVPLDVAVGDDHLPSTAARDQARRRRGAGAGASRTLAKAASCPKKSKK
jgi:chaperonin GroES